MRKTALSRRIKSSQFSFLSVVNQTRPRASACCALFNFGSIHKTWLNRVTEVEEIWAMTHVAPRSGWMPLGMARQSMSGGNANSATRAAGSGTEKLRDGEQKKNRKKKSNKKMYGKFAARRCEQSLRITVPPHCNSFLSLFRVRLAKRKPNLNFRAFVRKSEISIDNKSSPKGWRMRKCYISDLKRIPK